MRLLQGACPPCRIHTTLQCCPELHIAHSPSVANDSTVLRVNVGPPLHTVQPTCTLPSPLHHDHPTHLPLPCLPSTPHPTPPTSTPPPPPPPPPPLPPPPPPPPCPRPRPCPCPLRDTHAGVSTGVPGTPTSCSTAPLNFTLHSHGPQTSQTTSQPGSWRPPRSRFPPFLPPSPAWRPTFGYCGCCSTSSCRPPRMNPGA
jgi:hypothetical protein